MTYKKGRFKGFKGGRPLTDKEVQILRDKAKEYRDKGGNYLESVESN
jgi:hypothetical protein